MTLIVVVFVTVYWFQLVYQWLTSGTLKYKAWVVREGEGFEPLRNWYHVIAPSRFPMLLLNYTFTVSDSCSFNCLRPFRIVLTLGANNCIVSKVANLQNGGQISVIIPGVIKWSVRYDRTKKCYLNLCTE